MKQHIISSITQRPRRTILFGLAGGVCLLLILLAVNDRNWRPVTDKSDWTVTSNYSQEGAKFAIDLDLKTSWSSHVPMNFGMYFQVDMGSPAEINGILLRVDEDERQGQPVEWVVRTSVNGEDWQTQKPRESLRYREMLLIAFKTTRVRFVQIVQTSISATPWPWLIYELDVLKPVVPWQFHRTTLLYWIIGVLCVILSVLLFFPARVPASSSHDTPSGGAMTVDPGARTSCPPCLCRQDARALKSPVLSGGAGPVKGGLQEGGMATAERAFAPPQSVQGIGRPGPILLAMLLILLAGWGLRVYDLRSYELSTQEYQYYPTLSFGRYEIGEWISTYFGYSKTGASWLTLLSIRLMSRFTDSQLAAIRLIPAIWSVCTLFLMVFVWRFFSQGGMVMREAIFASACVSVSGFFVALSRTGDLHIPVLFFVLAYLPAAYIFLYNRGSSLWTVGLAIVLVVGGCVHPVLGFVPLTIALFALFHLVLCLFFPKFLQARHLYSFDPTHNFLRLLGYLVSVIPFVFYRVFFFHQQPFQQSIGKMALNGFYAADLGRALQSSGLTGIMFWLLTGIALIGFAGIVRQRSHGEWFLLLQGLLLAGIIVVFAPSERNAASLLLLLLLFLLLARGSEMSVSFLFPRVSNKKDWGIRISVFVVLAGYVGLFSMNTLFWGTDVLPYASNFHTGYRRMRAHSELINTIHDDPNPCKTVMLRDEILTDLYREEFGLRVSFLPFPDVQRLAEQGIFSIYLFLPLSELLSSQDAAAYVDQYYREYGRSLRFGLYQLKPEYSHSVRRYTARELFAGTGELQEDEKASSNLVRAAEPGDALDLLAFGPFCRVCQPGRYTVRYRLRAIAPPPDEVVAILEVVADTRAPLVRRELTGADFSDSSTYQNFDSMLDVDFAENSAYPMHRLQFFVHFPGNAELRMDYIELIPEQE